MLYLPITSKTFFKVTLILNKHNNLSVLCKCHWTYHNFNVICVNMFTSYFMAEDDVPSPHMCFVKQGRNGIVWFYFENIISKCNFCAYA